jgi:hypothetical protein
LGLNSAEFWQSTPRELTAQLKVWRRNEHLRMDAGYWQAGTIAAAIFNANPYRKGEVLDATSFFPHLSERERQKPDPTDDEIKQNAKATFVALGRIGTWHEAPKTPNE